MIKRLISWLFNWSRQHSGNHTFIILSSIVVGIVSALIAVVLKTFVHLMHRILDYSFQLSSTSIWYILLPFSGILLTIIVVFVIVISKNELIFSWKLPIQAGNLVLTRVLH